MEIDLIKIAKLGLTINEYLTLVMLERRRSGVDFPFTSTEKTLNSLKNSDHISISNTSMISLTSKGRKAISEPNEVINFDELFFLYENKTPSGRILRTKNKEIKGKLTKEYKTLRDKYLKKVTTEELHNDVVKATEAMLNDKRNRGSLEYLRHLEFYINRQEWEQYVGEEVKKKDNGANWERI